MPFASEKELAGRPEFIFIGEHPAIDFANTLALVHGTPKELLHAWPDLVDWLSQTKLTTDERVQLPAPAGTRALKKAIKFRQGWVRVLSQLVAGSEVSDAFRGQLNAFLALDNFHEILRRDGKSGFRLERSTSRLQGEELALSLIARQIADFLTEANPSYLRRCANTASCVLYFYDTTKNHRRQWCSIATCGNRHKVAAFRKRQSHAPPRRHTSRAMNKN